ncbi:YciI family protein [Mycobacterium paraseoulense]|uniref:Transcription initiation protein n=1 Tax=Mycobacterium paraseoulense TaxID=590652 RepID=A0A1X0IBZ4_9MYCO|nr:YciI family protein [Mycobacterium paraseoulense]MCV7394574.1 transcription initiation protein [Mycobacterium paraseoulense]ORB42319.1 transcription initiation protein [Mycobacterium paraseoulense]BBZ73503.1 transcription initiation protein [Mycobacterium paraseoulense]
MQYFALLIAKEQDRTPEEWAAGMAAWENFHAKAGAAIKAGDALAPAAAAVVISGGPDAPITTDGPFAEAAEVACGYYVFEAENLDEALALAREVPVAQFGAVELWPVVHSIEPSRKLTGNDWLALLLEPPASAHTPGTPEWEAVAARHADLHAAAGDHIIGGAALHDRSTATTVRVRDGEVLITDGPYVEGAEIATGVYLLAAGDRDEAVKLASMIPASTVQVRQLAGVSGL